jgi:branched-chain amino acid transport system ATP-binding protein
MRVHAEMDGPVLNQTIERTSQMASDGFAGASQVSPEATHAILSVEQLGAGYGDIQVLFDVTFSVREREILAILGSNGAGKTTLLRTISGLLIPRRGTIKFCECQIGGCNSDEIVKLGISQAPEGRRVFAGLTVEENLKLGAFRRASNTTPVPQRLDRIYSYFPRLRERRKQLAGTMSGGEQQMCAIGRALMAQPKLLIIDELSLGLAPLIVEELLGVLNEVHHTGTTVMLVEQDVSVALGFSDRAIVLQAGKVVLQGQSAELVKNENIIRSYLGG